MKKTLSILTSIVCLLFFSCKNENKNEDLIPKKRFLKMEKASWFLGEWENKSKEGIATEIWTLQSDSVYSGKSFIIKDKDTLFSEKMTITQKNDSLFYNVNVSNQNNGETISFYSTRIEEGQIVFENPKHDFPNKIVYNKINNDSIVAGIYGGTKYQSFPMKKKKN